MTHYRLGGAWPREGRPPAAVPERGTGAGNAPAPLLPHQLANIQTVAASLSGRSRERLFTWTV